MYGLRSVLFELLGYLVDAKFVLGAKYKLDIYQVIRRLEQNTS